MVMREVTLIEAMGWGLSWPIEHLSKIILYQKATSQSYPIMLRPFQNVDMFFSLLEMTLSYMDVSKTRGKKPKWIVYNGSNPMNKWMIWGVSHIFGSTPTYRCHPNSSKMRKCHQSHQSFAHWCWSVRWHPVMASLVSPSQKEKDAFLTKKKAGCMLVDKGNINCLLNPSWILNYQQNHLRLL